MSRAEHPRVPLDTAAFPGPWRERGACRAVPTAVFFPARGAPVEPAKEVCAACPVRQQCLDYALPLSDLKGVWGGLAEVERRRLRRARAEPSAPPPIPVAVRRRRTPPKGGALYRTLEELAASPGEWARVVAYPRPYTAAGMVGRLRAKTVAVPPGIWQFEARQSDDGGSGLWAHYEPAEPVEAGSRDRAS